MAAALRRGRRTGARGRLALPVRPSPPGTGKAWLARPAAVGNNRSRVSGRVPGSAVQVLAAAPAQGALLIQRVHGAIPDPRPASPWAGHAPRPQRTGQTHKHPRCGGRDTVAPRPRVGRGRGGVHAPTHRGEFLSPRRSAARDPERAKIERGDATRRSAGRFGRGVGSREALRLNWDHPIKGPPLSGRSRSGCASPMPPLSLS